MTSQPFDSFSRDLLPFLEELRENNSRDWFHEHKSVYESLYKKPALDFCAAMEEELQELTGLVHSSKLFRIHRDLRFSKDKNPYNTHLRVSFTPQGTQGTAPHWMFGLEPGDLTVGVGIFRFDPADLRAYRERIDSPAGTELVALLADLESQGARVSEPDLKRTPKGYAADHEQAVLLRHKGLAVWLGFAKAEHATRGDLVPECLSRFRALLPAFDWLRAIS